MFVNPVDAHIQKKYIFFCQIFFTQSAFSKLSPEKKNFFALPKIENLQKGRHLL